MIDDDIRLTHVRSSIKGIAWPPVLDGPPAALAGFLHQLDRSQWLEPEAIRDGQFRQLRALAEHAQSHSPHFARRLQAAGLDPARLATPEGLASLAILRRRALQDGDDVACREVPPDHMPVHVAQTSGSVGEPVRIRRTAISNLIWLAHLVREEHWHRRDLTTRRCSIRATATKVMHFPTWGGMIGDLFPTGEVLVIPTRLGIAEQLARIDEFQPDSLVVYPSMVAALIEACRARGRGFDTVRHLRLLGETVPAWLREEAGRYFGALVTETYSAEELGYLTIECPDTPYHHIMAETAIVELLRDDGTPCREGELGRVVVTDLHNFATPLIRYDLGDFAEAGPRCPCRRGLPTIKRIVGRERGLVRLPDGRRHWPWFGSHYLRDAGPVRQFQVIQHSLERIELRLHCNRPLTSGEEDGVGRMIGQALDHDFAIDYRYYDTPLPTGPSGKFDEFICRIDAPA